MYISNDFAQEYFIRFKTPQVRKVRLFSPALPLACFSSSNKRRTRWKFSGRRAQLQHEWWQRSNVVLLSTRIQANYYNKKNTRTITKHVGGNRWHQYQDNHCIFAHSNSAMATVKKKEVKGVRRIYFGPLLGRIWYYYKACGSLKIWSLHEISCMSYM